MTSLVELARADADRIFSDWGRSAQLIEVVSFYDPASGQLEESETVTEIVVIPTDAAADRFAFTLAHAPFDQRTFLVRKTDLPPDVTLTSARIRIASRTLEIQDVVETSLNGIFALHTATDDRREPS